MKTDKDFLEWYQTATQEEKDLLGQIFEYEKLYFEDMTFKQGSLCHDFLCSYTQDKSGKLIEAPYNLSFDLSHTRCIVKIKWQENTLGEYDPVDHIIVIGPECRNNVSVIVHEMIHAYEGMLLKYGQTLDLYVNLRDLLILSLYNHLKSKIEDLDNKVKAYAHIFVQEDITDIGGFHGILFFLKSLDLDIRLGLKLGTVCGYDSDGSIRPPGDEI